MPPIFREFSVSKDALHSDLHTTEDGSELRGTGDGVGYDLRPG